ncbi:hypothetical protein CBW16_08375 [Flavobacteriaceae bacterium JJC]|nr:hypothetical protein CBW16_08375 [Flavobacteriaceae bacterium JJC]
MKKILYIVLLFISAFGYAQKEQNPFGQTEYENAATKEDNSKDDVQSVPDITGKDGPGNPGPTNPIDDYIPLLIITALGMIVYHTYKKRASL